MSIALFILAAAAAARVPANEPQSVGIQAVHNYGACVVSRTPEGARKLLAMDFNSPEYAEQARRYLAGNDRCMPFDARLQSSRLLFAGAMAEALLKLDVKHDQLPQRLAYDPARETIVARSPMEDMALCTVLQAPKETAKIFDTDPATSDEVEAMTPIGGVLGECLKKDMKLTVDKPGLRALLALAAWRIVNTPEAPAQ
jgi:hypothetical protein